MPIKRPGPPKKLDGEIYCPYCRLEYDPDVHEKCPHCGKDKPKSPHPPSKNST